MSKSKKDKVVASNDAYQQQFLKRVEETIFRTLTETDAKVFLTKSRIMAEGVLEYLLLKSGKAHLINRANPLTIKDLKKLVPNHPYSITYIQNYGNVGAHFDLNEIQLEEIIPCKIAVSDLVRFFYKKYLKTSIPATMTPYLMESRSNQFKNHSTNYARILNDIWTIINALKYDKKVLPGKFYNLLETIYEFILTEQEKKINPKFLRENGRELDFNKVNEHLKNKNYISTIHATHLKHLVSYALNNLKPVKPNKDETIHAVYDTFISAVVLFFKRYIGDLPEDLSEIFQLQQKSKVRVEPKKNPKIIAWLIRNDERQSMAYSLREGLNTIGRQGDLRDLTDKIIINDIQISRQHASIEVTQEKDGSYRFCLSDSAPSRNGTFVNSPDFRLSPSDKVYLEEDDIILLGTDLIKLIFKPAIIEEIVTNELGMQTKYDEI